MIFRKRLYSLLLALVLAVGLAAPAMAGGRDFAFDVGITFTLDTASFDYGTYISETYGSDAFFSLPGYETYWNQLEQVYSAWMASIEPLYDALRAAQDVLLPRSGEWRTIDPPVVLTVADGTTVSLSLWDTSTGAFVSDTIFNEAYGGADKVPAITGVVSVPVPAGYTVTQTSFGNNRIVVRVVPNDGFPPVGYDSVVIPLPKLTGGGDAVPPVAPPTVVDETLSDWAVTSVSTAIAAGLVPAQLQSHYQNTATRAEFCALAVALYETVAGMDIGDRVIFLDTDDVNVQKMAAVGVVNGTGNGIFSPDDSLTREQAATMLSRLAEALDSPLPAAAATFADSGDVAPWATAAVGQMQASGIMGGVGGNAFAPQGSYTREQCIITLLRLFDTVG